MSLSCYWQWISSSHCQSILRIHSAIASWIHSYFDNVMMKFMINNRTYALKTDVNLLICPQVDASVSQFGHPTQVDASWETSINQLLANEI